MRFKPAKSGGPLSVSTVCRAAPHTCGSDSCLILPFAIEVLKDGVIAYLADCWKRGNSNGTMSNKSVRVKAVYTAQLG
jgi:hypothetical protein